MSDLNVLARDGVPADRSGSIATGSIAQPFALGLSSRGGYRVMNTNPKASGIDVWVNDMGVDASPGGSSYRVEPGSHYCIEQPACGVMPVSIYSTTAGAMFMGSEWLGS